MNATPVIDMIIRSGWMGRLIIFLLVLLSFITWAIIFSRLYVLSKVNGGNKSFRHKWASLGKLSDVEKLESKLAGSPLGQMARRGSLEMKRILEDARSHTGVKDWSFFLQNQFTMAADHLESILMSLIAPLDKGVLMLAMTSAIAPFLGLLGTVWGIMNSFYEIGNQGSASLPVVAPGIAEALITTIVGLMVAIPALFFYNYFNHKIEKIENEMDEFKELLTVRLKREIFSMLFTEQQGRPHTQSNRQM
ncbi:MAG: MotA/TolQ/ExbB proton channel family protein [Fibrobacter sp.]|nr:MotA/TolQ/ExbB proton channel family protein [Fibrobacter sp.]